MSRSKERLTKIYDMIQSEWTDMVQLAQQLDEDTRRLKPTPDKWSVDDILWHLYLAEKMSLQYIRKKLAHPDKLLPSGFSARKNSTVLKTFLRSPAKAKVPTQIADIPQEHTGDALIAAWKDLRSDMAALIENTEIDQLDQLVYRHPIMGRMDMRGAMTFFYEHQRRHAKQLTRTAQSVAK